MYYDRNLFAKSA